MCVDILIGRALLTVTLMLTLTLTRDSIHFPSELRIYLWGFVTAEDGGRVRVRATDVHT